MISITNLMIVNSASLSPGQCAVFPALGGRVGFVATIGGEIAVVFLDGDEPDWVYLSSVGGPAALIEGAEFEVDLASSSGETSEVGGLALGDGFVWLVVKGRFGTARVGLVPLPSQSQSNVIVTFSKWRLVINFGDRRSTIIEHD